MRLKELNKSGIFCWSPLRTQPFIAIANANQQFDNNFGSQSRIELFDLCLNESDERIEIISCIESGDQNYTSMCWHPNDLLLLGTKAATIQVLNTSAKSIKKQFEAKVKTSNETVNCLDLNENDKTLICSGSNDGSITIWDFNESLKTISTLSPTIPSPNDEVISVAWNKQVKSIIASVTNSNVYIYDIRKKEQITPIMQVSDSNAVSVWGPGAASITYPKAAAWSHNYSTTLIIASANDTNPHLQLWDLRYATCPLRYFKGGHNRGVVTVAWNRFDEEILLSAAKDNTVCIWNPAIATNENPLLSVIPSVYNQWINDVKWCPWEPSLFAVGSLDGKTTIYNVTKTNVAFPESSSVLNSFGVESPFMHRQQISQAPMQLQPQIVLPYAPKWLRKPFGMSWAFGGKLIKSMIVEDSTTQSRRHCIVIEQVVHDQQFLSRAEKIENAISNDNLLEFCKFKTNEYYTCKNEALGLAWRLTETHFYANELEKLQEVLMLLGYPNEADLSQSLSNLDLCDQNSNRSPIFNKTFSPSTDQSDYDERQTGTCNTTTATTSPEPQYSKIFTPSLVQSQHPIKIDTGMESDKCLGHIINHCILTGQYKKGIELCISEGCWTEALLMSWFVDSDSFVNTLKQYFSHTSSNNSKNWSPLLWCMIAGRVSLGDSDKCDINVLQQLVLNIDLKSWRETLVFILKETANDNRKLKCKLIDSLAERLLHQYEQENNYAWIIPALYCYILSGNYENISKYCQTICGGFLNTMEFILVLKNALPANYETPSADEMLVRYAEHLCCEGKLNDAFSYLKDTPESDLKCRLSVCLYYRKPTTETRSRTLSQSSQISSSYNYQKNTFSQPYGTTYYPSTSPPGNLTSKATLNRPPPTVAAVEPIKTYSTRPRYPDSSYPPQNLSYSQQNQFYQPLVPTPTSPPPSVKPIPDRIGLNTTMQTRQQPISTGWNDPPPLRTTTSHSYSKLQPMVIQNPVPIYEPSEPPQTPIANQQINSQSRRSSLSRLSQAPTPPPPVQLSYENQQLFSQYEALLQQIQHQLQVQSQFSMNMRRKLDDIRVKLDNMKLKLSQESSLSPVAINGLKEIISALNQNDYNRALTAHSHLVASTTFGETADFLPAIKVLLHLSHQYLHF